MSFNAFVQVDGVEAEATEEGHEKWIAIDSYSFGVSQTSMMSGGHGGRQGGKADFNPLTITHTIDKSSPTLALFCANGKQIAKIVLEACSATGKKTKFFSITLTNAMVASVVQNGANTADSPRPTESISFVYDKIIWSYFPMKKDGSPGAEAKQGFDIAANKPATS